MFKLRRKAIPTDPVQEGFAYCGVCNCCTPDQKRGEGGCYHYKNWRKLKPTKKDIKEGIKEVFELKRPPWEINKDLKCKWFSRVSRKQLKRKCNILKMEYRKSRQLEKLVKGK